jgi:hypothetical protein
MADLFSDEDKLKCVERELRLRRNVYPGRISRGAMSLVQAQRELALMAAIAADYRAKVQSLLPFGLTGGT